MLFVSWQLKTIVSVIFLTLCSGQEVFRVYDYCDERTIGWQKYDNKYLEREQSRLLRSEINRSDENNNGIFKYDEGQDKHRVSVEAPSGTKDRAASDVTRNLICRLSDRPELSRFSSRHEYQVLRQLPTEAYRTPLVKRHNEKHLNDHREENAEVLDRRDELTGVSMPGGLFGHSGTEHGENFMAEGESYFRRRQSPNDGQIITLQRFDNREYFNNMRDISQNNERTQCFNTNYLDKSARYEISKRRLVITSKRNNNENRNIESNETNKLSVRKGQELYTQGENKRERNNRDNVHRESQDKTRRVIKKEIQRNPQSSSEGHLKGNPRYAVDRVDDTLPEKHPVIGQDLISRISENIVRRRRNEPLMQENIRESAIDTEVRDRQNTAASSPGIRSGEVNRLSREQHKNIEHRKDRKIISEEERVEYIGNFMQQDGHENSVRVELSRSHGLQNYYSKKFYEIKERRFLRFPDKKLFDLTVFFFNGFVALGQGMLFSYVIIKTLYGKKGQKRHLAFGLGDTLKIIGF